MKRKAMLSLAVIGLLTTASPLTLVFASETAAAKKTLGAYYGVQIEYNSKVLSSETAPFIVNGTTYVPLRMLMDTFSDKNTTWDADINGSVEDGSTTLDSFSVSADEDVEL